jgi:hypothetical protein
LYLSFGSNATLASFISQTCYFFLKNKIICTTNTTIRRCVLHRYKRMFFLIYAFRKDEGIEHTCFSIFTCDLIHSKIGLGHQKLDG